MATRKYTNKLIDMINSEEVDATEMLKNILTNVMSEDEVRDFALDEGYIEDDEDDEDDEEGSIYDSVYDVEDEENREEY